MRRFLFVMTLVAAFVLLGGGLAFAQASAPPASWSVTDCQGCHEKALGPGFTHTKHASLDLSCAKCHQNVGEHAKAQMAGEKGPVPSLKGLKASQLNETCLSCHEKAGQANYLSSMHARRNVACTSCHSVHDFKTSKAQLKTATESEACFQCHKTERAKSMRTSHHPVREGKMGCTSCHNPHDGSQPKMLQGRLGQRALLQVPRREAGALRLRARAGPRGLRVVPRTARHESPAAADAEGAESLLELPHLRLGPLPAGRQRDDRAGRHGRPRRIAEWLPGRSGALRRAELPELPRQDPRFKPPVRRLLCEVTHEAND